MEPKKKNEWVEEINVAGRDLVDRVKELVAEGNVRKLIIYRKNGETLMEVPLTASVVAGSAMLVFTPMFAALGALAAFIAEVRIEVVRMSEEEVEEEKAKRDSDEAKKRIELD